MATAEFVAARDRRVDLYEVLQVSPKAMPEVIQAAYRALARAYHPDVNPSPEAAREMRQLNAAYGVLSDATKRARYDSLRSRPRRTHTAVGSEQFGRATSRPTPIRPTATSVVSPLPRTGGVRMGRVLALVVCVLLIIGTSIYGLVMLAGVLDDEPTRAMVVTNPDMPRRVDAPADIVSSAMTHSDAPGAGGGR